MGKNDFWDAPKKTSIIKMDIAANYFAVWASFMLYQSGGKSLTYLDLCSGRGVYRDGYRATPLKILDKIGSISGLMNHISLKFYEEKKSHYDELKKSLENHQTYDLLEHTPDIKNKKVGKDTIASLPQDDYTFCFIDPYGYKGLSVELVLAVTSGWGNDCLFYLSTRGIGRNLENDLQRENMEDLFGTSGYKSLRKEFDNGLRGEDLDELILLTMKQHMVQLRDMYFLPFCVEHERKQMVSHYLVFVSKSWKAFQLMKEEMARESFRDADDFPTFKFAKDTQVSLPFESRLMECSNRMLNDFARKELTVGGVIEQCNRLGYEGTRENLKDAMRHLEGTGEAFVDKPARERRMGTNGKRTLGDGRTITFSK